MDIRRSGKSPEQSKEDTGEDTTQQTSSGSSNNNGGGIAGPMLAILVLIVLVIAGIYLFGNTGDSGSSATGPVATVGGQEIDSQQFNEQLSALRESTSSRAQEFQSLSETRQQELILSGLINQELLRQAAVNAGVSVSDSEVDSRLQSQIEQIGGESEFESRLSQNDLTREEVRENLRQQMLINAYVEQTATTTDQQVQQLYNQYRSQLSQGATSSQNIPSLEQLRPRLEASIQQQNRQQLLRQARDSIEVEVLLEGVSYPPSSQTQQQPQPSPNVQQPNQPQPQPESEPETETDAQATTSGEATTQQQQPESAATGSTAQ